MNKSKNDSDTTRTAGPSHSAPGTGHTAESGQAHTAEGGQAHTAGGGPRAPWSPWSAAANPTGVAAAGAEAFLRMTRAELDRARALADQMASVERQVAERLKAAASEGARLLADSLDYASALAGQWRTLAFDAARSAAGAGQE